MKNVITLMTYLLCVVLFAFACSSEQCQKPKIDIGENFNLINLESIQCCEVKRESGKVDVYTQRMIEDYPWNVEQDQADLADFSFSMKDQSDREEYTLRCPIRTACSLEEHQAALDAQMRRALKIQACAVKECQSLGEYDGSVTGVFFCRMSLEAALTLVEREDIERLEINYIVPPPI